MRDTVCNLSPAWSEIPAHPTNDDVARQLRHCESEYEELEEAYAEWQQNPCNATFAHFAEEVCDGMVSNLTLLKMLERLEECPCGDYAEITLLFTHIKNKRRGYHEHNDKE